METWRDVPGWSGYYEVSNLGNVRSVDRTLTFSDGRVRAFKGAPRATHTDSFGYKKVTLKRAGVNQRVLIHQIVATTWIGPRPAGLQVCHGDGDKTNNAASNLRYDTPAANHADAVRHGTAHRPRKLSDETVAAIRAAKGQATFAVLSEKFGVSRTHVYNLQNGHRRA